MTATQLHPIDPARWWQARRLLHHHPGFVLDGARPGHSFLGLAPMRHWRSDGAETLVRDAHGSRRLALDPLDAIDELWQPSGGASPFPFAGGLVGYFAYELAPWFEPSVPAEMTELPLSAWMQVDSVLVWDHTDDRVWLAIRPGADGAGELARWERLWAETPPVAGPFQAGPAVPSVDVRGYGRMVRAAQAHIEAGDIYQANLAIAFSAEVEGDPFTCYERLRQGNPGPFNAYVNFGDFQILSGSPERLVTKRGAQVSTRPIAGTRPRGTDAAADLALADELLLHPKERAEHVMLVDLARNDLGRLCRPGTVRVDELMTLESYAHVHHIVSNVVGDLVAETDWRAILRALFPGGTITGAPKVRAMQVIADLEPGPRGIYTGAIGYLADSGDLDLNIAIRTAVVSDGRIVWHAGAGIVADSIPEQEYAECGHKARALHLAIGSEEAVHA